MFDMILKFETAIRVSALDKEFDELLSDFCATPYVPATITNELELKNSPVIPNDEQIQSFVKTINNSVKKLKLERKFIVLDTKFVGFSKISQR